MRGAKPPKNKTFYLDGKNEVGRRKGGRRDTPGSNWQSKCQVWRGNFTESVEEISRNSSNRPGHTISERKKKHEKNDWNFLCAQMGSQMSSNVKIFDESYRIVPVHVFKVRWRRRFLHGVTVKGHAHSGQFLAKLEKLSINFNISLPSQRLLSMNCPDLSGWFLVIKFLWAAAHAACLG